MTIRALQIRANRRARIRELHHIIPEVSKTTIHEAVTEKYAKSSFNFLTKVVRNQRWPTTPLFVVNISPSCGEFAAPLHHILPIHNVTIDSNYLLWISAGRSPFALRNRIMERTSHLAGLCIGAAISNTSHSNKAGLTSQTSTAHSLPVSRAVVDGSVAIINIKNFPIGLHVMYLSFPDTPRNIFALYLGSLRDKFHPKH